MVTSDLKAEVEIWPFRACAMHPVIIIIIIIIIVYYVKRQHIKYRKQNTPIQ